MEQLCAVEMDVLEAVVPPAIVPAGAARAVLAGLAADDARSGGRWVAARRSWRLFDRPWRTPQDPGGAVLLGSVYVSTGDPTPDEVTVTQAGLTKVGTARGYDVPGLCDAALGYGGLTLERCPRSSQLPPPRQSMDRRSARLPRTA